MNLKAGFQRNPSEKIEKIYLRIDNSFHPKLPQIAPLLKLDIK